LAARLTENSGELMKGEHEEKKGKRQASWDEAEGEMKQKGDAKHSDHSAMP
jgi:hypothetical protein